jgi:PiT family inorganic phosphate transporter
LLAFTLGWNNSGVFTGNLSNLLAYGLALGVTLLGMLIGYAVEGPKMSQSSLGKLVSSQLAPAAVAAAVATSFGLFLALTVARVPVSLSNCVVGAFAGVALAAGALIDAGELVKVVASWVLAPFLCAALAIGMYELAVRSEARLALTTVSWANSIALVLGVFYLSYALGANNIGMIFSFVTQGSGQASEAAVALGEQVAIYLAVAAGTVIFGKGIAMVVSDRITGLSQTKTLAAILGAAIVTWSLTQFSIPVSLTQVVIGGMLGAGVVRAPAVVNGPELYTMIRDWTIVTVLCAALGYGVEFLLLRLF